MTVYGRISSKKVARLRYYAEEQWQVRPINEIGNVIGMRTLHSESELFTGVASTDNHPQGLVIFFQIFPLKCRRSEKKHCHKNGDGGGGGARRYQNN